MAVQKYDDLFNPVLRALYDLGGSASVSEMEDKVSEIIKLSDEDANDIHRGNITKLSYRLAWARTYLKRFGLLENSSRSTWSLTAKGKTVKTVDKNEVKKFIQSLDKRDPSQENGRSIIVHPDKDHLRLESLDLPTWQDKILTITSHYLRQNLKD